MPKKGLVNSIWARVGGMLVTGLRRSKQQQITLLLEKLMQEGKLPVADLSGYSDTEREALYKYYEMGNRFDNAAQMYNFLRML